MILWELNFSEDISTYVFPDKQEEQQFLALEEDIFDTASSAASVWSPFMIQKGEQKIDTDITELEEMGYTILNEKCRQLISPLFKRGEIELLEFRTETDTSNFYLLNVVGFIENALDENSIQLLKTSMNINSDIKEINFIERNINRPVFKIKELPHSIFVTDDFVDVYEKNNLTGLIFNDDNIFWRI